jgi:hypothetical protein
LLFVFAFACVATPVVFATRIDVIRVKGIALKSARGP